jgi:hypothetical protein
MSPARLSFASFVIAVSTGAAFAQASNTAPGHADPYTHDKYITGTGATVPNPGKSQSGGTTSVDRGIQQRDTAIEKDICKGC